MRARKFIDLQRVDGEFRRLEAALPGAGRCRVFADEDKNYFTIRKEVATNRLKRAIADITKLQVFASKSDGQVSYRWTPLAKVVVPDAEEDDIRIKWNLPYAEAHKVDKAAVEEEFKRSNISKKPDVLWG